MTSSKLHSFIERFSRVIVLIVLLVFFSLSTDTFWSINNWTNVLNIVLDPVFMFAILPEGQEVAGAGMATMLSNVISLCYFLLVFFRLRNNTVLSLSIHRLPAGMKHAVPVFSVGFPSALSSLLACISNMTANNLASGYGDIPVAAIGLVKKINMLPMNVGMGLCQGMLPLVAYNYAAKNYKRMKSVINLCPHQRDGICRFVYHRI